MTDYDCFRCFEEACEAEPLLTLSPRMIVCPKCGDKRCKRADDHRLDCSTPPAMTLPTPTPLTDAPENTPGYWFKQYCEAMSNYGSQVLRAEAAEADLQRTREALSDIANTYDSSWREGSQERTIGDKARALLTPPTGT